MKPFVSKSASKSGVKLITTSRKSDCDIDLVIPNQYCTKKRSLIVDEYPVFKLKVKFTCKGETYPKGVCLSFKSLPYPTNDNGEVALDKVAFITLDLSDENYSGTLIIYRSGYMSSEVLGMLRKRRKALNNAK